MSYVIIGDLFTFPEGEAATNRVHTYAKGFVSNGRDVHVICFGNVYTHYGTGEISGIKYYHPFEQTKRSPWFVVRTWKKILKYFRTAKLLLKLNRKKKIQGIIVYSGIPGTFLFSWLLSHIINARLIQEISEHPMRYYLEGNFRKKMGLLKVRVESALADGILCISHFLIDFYTDRGFPIHKLLLVPSTVDPTRFDAFCERPLPYPYIGYFGMLTFRRDNVDLLIEAFASVSSKHPEMNLVLGGPEYGAQRKDILKLAEDLGISSKLNLLDYMPREEVIKYIANSEVLVMVRSNDLKAQASFPSKLTEYLATGKPVISVNVGEISDYLSDGVNAYLVDPGNKEILARKIDQVLSNYDSALEVAGRGKQLTKSIFNYSYQAKKIIQFIDSLSKAN